MKRFFLFLVACVLAASFVMPAAAQESEGSPLTIDTLDSSALNVFPATDMTTTPLGTIPDGTTVRYLEAVAGDGVMWYRTCYLGAELCGWIAIRNAEGENQWDQLICSGLEGVVWREVNATTSSLPSVEGCSHDDAAGWFIVEPWGPNGQNVDRGCFADSWTEVNTVAAARNWVNGSAWRVQNEFAENPLVVACETVTADPMLGLNPYEDQVRISELGAFITRANELLAAHQQTQSSYASAYPETTIDDLFLLIGTFNLAG